MKLNKRVRAGFFALLSVFLFLFVALIVHIVNAPSLEVDNATMQIARIDFREPVDALKAKDIHRHMKSIPGVSHDKIFPDKGVMVYWLDNRVTSSKEVFELLVAKGNYDAAPFLVPATVAQRGVCPAMDPDSFKYKFSLAVQRLFR